MLLKLKLNIKVELVEISYINCWTSVAFSAYSINIFQFRNITSYYLKVIECSKKFQCLKGINKIRLITHS